MQTQDLSQIKQQIVLLDPDSKKQLAAFLADEIDEPSRHVESSASDEDRQSQIEWLRKNREIYAGRYIALSGAEMVGEGQTLDAARTEAKNNGFPHAFVTYIYSENDEPFGGW